MPYERGKYRKGYSIGVGGVVLYQHQALLIRRALGRHVGDWAIPSGFVERGETIETAIRREVWEEAGVEAEIEGLIAVRSRVTEEENNAYLIFLLRALNGACRADGHEVDEARLFDLAAIQKLPRLQPFSRMLVTRALQGQVTVLHFQAHPHFPPEEYVIYM